MNKINVQSEDILEDTIKKLKEVYPPLFDDEGNLNEEELRNLVNKFPVTTSGRYEFNWAGKMSAKRNAYKVSKAALKPKKEKSIDFDTTQNIVIEGDNLEVLKLLQKSYFNKIKCIYIDPPYNTGKDFIYSDNFTENKKAYWEQNGVMKEGVKLDTNLESQGRYHSNWLNMIYPRLLLARNLLKEDGVIFVSIDDNEVHNLRKVMDEVFGEENFITCFVWQKKYGGGNDSGKVAMEHEYILCYSKSQFGNQWFEPHTVSYLKRYKEEDEQGRFFWDTLERPGLNNPIEVKITSSTGKIYLLKTFRSQARIETDIKNGDVRIIENGTKISFQFKQRLREGKKPRSILRDFNKVYEEELSKAFIRIGSNSTAKNEFVSLMGADVFDNPKPVSLIKYFLQLIDDKDYYVLDFFAGSGTTAQAVMELNKVDGGTRKYILVQIPEATDESSEAYKAGYKTISDICIERVKRVSEKMKKENEGKLFDENDGLDLGFKVLNLAPSFFPENTFTPDPEKGEEENTLALQEYIKRANEQLQLQFDEEELVYELLLKDGFEINFTRIQLPEFDKNKVYKVSDGTKEALVSIDASLDNATIQMLEKYKDSRLICLERALDTTKKWNLKKIFDSNLWVA